MFTGPNIVTNGLVLNLDAANVKSYAGSGTTWRDLSGNANNGVFTGSIPIYNNNNLGTILFNNSGSFINYNSSPIKNYFSGLTNATLEMWTYISSGSVGFIMGFVPQNNNSGNRFSIGANPNYLYFQVEKSGVGSFPSCSYFQNSWNHVVLSYDGSLSGLSRISAYINGIPQTLANGGSAPATTLSSALSDFNIGNVTIGNVFIQRVVGYNRTLSSIEVLQNYNGIKSRFGL